MGGACNGACGIEYSASDAHGYAIGAEGSRLCGGDICGNDLTRAQARADAHAALRAARRLSLPHGTVLFKDIEQVSSCTREPSADYLDAWYRTLKGTDFVTGVYGNAYQQNYDFPRGYCAEVKRAADFAADVVLDMNEDEPLIGAPRGSARETSRRRSRSSPPRPYS